MLGVRIFMFSASQASSCLFRYGKEKQRDYGRWMVGRGPAHHPRWTHQHLFGDGGGERVEREEYPSIPGNRSLTACSKHLQIWDWISRCLTHVVSVCRSVERGRQKIEHYYSYSVSADLKPWSTGVVWSEAIIVSRWVSSTSWQNARATSTQHRHAQGCGNNSRTSAQPCHMSQVQLFNNREGGTDNIRLQARTH